MQEGAGGGGPGDAAQDKRDMQSEITFSMYAVRVAEMKVCHNSQHLKIVRLS